MQSFDFSSVKALIFDLDGTLADTMPLHLEACNLVCNELGFDFPEDYFYQEAGKPTLEVFRNLMVHLNLPYNGDELGKKKEVKVLEIMYKVKFVPVVHQIFQQYKNSHAVAIGSGGQKHTVLLTLQYLVLSEADFGAVVTCDDVEHHKPHPETFLKAAQILGVEPKDCVVLEDGDPGIKAAIDAGMQYIDIRKLL